MQCWYEQAYEELEQDLHEGLISMREYNQAIRDINLELEALAREISWQDDIDFEGNY